MVRSGLHDDRGKTDVTMRRNDASLKQSSSFVVTNSELPIVDISAFNYAAYRHQLIEAALRKQYDDYQPPGDVVLNSIHLNNNDSAVAVRLNDRYHHSFFDFVEEYYDATTGMSKKETEYLHPLDHFLVKGTQKPETVEKETETRAVDVIDSADQDEKSPRISFYDDTVGRSSSTQKKQLNGDLDINMKRSSRISKARPSSAGVDSSASRRIATSHTAGKRSATMISRPPSSSDSVSSKRDTFSGSQKRDNRRETLSSNDGAERESINCTTISSIDSESARSESSKFRDDHSCHSHDSSVASKPCTTDRPQAQPWFIGNSRMSFNKKYGTSIKSLNKTFKVTRTNSTMKKPDTSSQFSSSKQTVHPKVEYTAHTSSNLSQLGKKPERSSRIESKHDLKSTSVARTNHLRSNEPEKLEVIRSETEVISKPDLSSLVNNLPARRLANYSSGRPSRSSSKFSPEALPKFEMPESMDCFVEVTRQPPGEPRLKTIRSKELPKESHVENKKAEDLECSRLPSMQSQPEKFAKRYRNRRQRSRTSSHKIELSMETLPPKDEFHEHIPVNSITNGSNEKRKDRSYEWSQWLRENRKPKVGANSKPDSYGKKHTPGAAKCKEEVKASSAKLTDDFNGRKAAGAMKILGATSVKPGFSTNSKQSSFSRKLQQRVVASKVNTGLHDSVSGVLSVQIRSSKSPSNEKRILKTAKPEKTGASQAAMEDNSAGGLKLPRRDSKAGIAMQVGLRKYIKKLKRVLSDCDNTNIGELASLSLTDAIMPELESTLSSMEVQQVQNLLNMAEKSQS